MKVKSSLRPRRCLHSHATFESSDEIEEVGVVPGEFIVSGCDPSEMFDLVEEAFDQITVFIEGCVEGSPSCGNLSSRDDRPCARRGDRIHGASAIIAFVGEDMVCAQPSEKPLDLGDVVALAAGQNEANRVAQSVGRYMDLCAQPALGASQRVSFKPIFGSIAFFGAPALC